ncbi:hypothetical protein SEA_SAMPSON_59 [Gordonia Phage Sampson]|uniref:Uncharacterized protein n=1 Tax=Gordonia Phage Sampson TaxID=2951393 RepID=A0A9E7NGP5_9CAUD|nr:hypothetical protein SEA_SAMPSON_59 [Gordonia Phage Sampson]
MTHHDTPRTPRTPRTDAEHFINRARTTTHLVDVPGIGAVATAAAILDLADAIRETRTSDTADELHHDEFGGAYLTGQDTATMTMGDVQAAIRDDSETIEVLADAVVDTDGPQAGQWLVVRTSSDYRSTVTGPFRTADAAHSWADENDSDPGIVWTVTRMMPAAGQ